MKIEGNGRGKGEEERGERAGRRWVMNRGDGTEGKWETEGKKDLSESNRKWKEGKEERRDTQKEA